MELTAQCECMSPQEQRLDDRIKGKVVRAEMIDAGPRQDHAPILLEIEI